MGKAECIWFLERGLARPNHVSRPRWNAMISHLVREYGIKYGNI